MKTQEMIGKAKKVRFDDQSSSEELEVEYKAQS